MREIIIEGIRRHILPLKGVENAQLLEVSPGHSRLSFTIEPEALNLYGNLHGDVCSPYVIWQREFLLMPSRWAM